MAENSLVFNMIANSSNFTAGMKQAQKAADSLFMATRTGAEKFAIELENLQKIAHLTKMDPDTFQRAYGRLKDTYDPFGVNAQQTAADAEKRIAMDKAEYIARVSENAKRMQFSHAQQIQQASVRQDTAEIQSTKSRTAAIIAAERTAAQARINHLKTVAAFRERVAEQSGRALIREAQQEARAASIMQMGGGAGGNRAMIVQQLAFAAEDAATQFGTRGLAGAMMAAGNNLTFAASMINPLTGVLASVGMTAAMVAATFFKLGSGAKKAAEETKSLKDTTRELMDVFRQRREFVEFLQSGGTPELAGRRKSIQGEISDQQKAASVARQKFLRAERDVLEAESKLRRDLAFRAESGGSGVGAGGMQVQMVRQTNEEIEKGVRSNADLLALREKLNQAAEEELRIKREIGVADSRISEINDQIARNREAARNQLRIDAYNNTLSLRREEEKKMEEAAKQIRMQDPAFRLNEELKSIDKLKERKILTEAEYQKERKRLFKEAEDQIRGESAKTRSNNQTFGAFDIRSAEAFGVLAKAQASAITSQPSQNPRQVLEQQLKQLNTITNQQEKMTQILDRQLGEAMRNRSTPVMVVELN